ncbi:MAG: hypothetical protein ACREFD_13985 [Stellaceae bacterium]
MDHLAEIRQKIADLRRLQKVMGDMAAQCSRNRIPQCPIVDALFRDGAARRHDRPPKRQ